MARNNMIWRQGYADFNDGELLTDNPYVIDGDDDEDFFQWHDGWIAAKEDDYWFDSENFEDRCISAEQERNEQ